MHRSYTYAWLAALVLVLAVEAIALHRAAPGDTLSEHVWRIMQRPLEGGLVFGVLAWLLLWHFPFGGPGQRLGWPDLAAFAAGAVWRLVATRLTP